MEWARLVEAVHLLLAMAVVGGQLLLTIAALRRRPAGSSEAERVAWQRLERWYRRVAIPVLVLTAFSGFLFLRYTLVTRALLATTPYGPLLVAKVGLWAALVAHLSLAPLSTPPSAADGVSVRRLSALFGSALAIALVIVSLALRYP
jgi:putative copper export protein